MKRQTRKQPMKKTVEKVAENNDYIEIRLPKFPRFSSTSFSPIKQKDVTTPLLVAILLIAAYLLGFLIEKFHVFV